MELFLKKVHEVVFNIFKICKLTICFILVNSKKNNYKLNSI